VTVDAGRLHAHHSAPRDDTPDGARDVTGATSAPAIARHDSDELGDPIVMALRRRLKELDTQLLEERAKHARELAAAEVRAERLRAWLVVIRLTCKGGAPGLASQAIHSTDWPKGRRLPSERTISRPEEESQGHDHD
jgi:hypothetical protein